MPPRSLLVFLSFALPSLAQTTPPAFVNPGEVTRRDGKLQAVVMLSDADRNVQGLGVKHLRYFQGWDPARPDQKAPADAKGSSRTMSSPTCCARTQARRSSGTSHCRTTIAS